VLVVGTGSAGQRHIRNLLALGADVSAFSYRGLTSVPGAPGVRMFGRIEDGLGAGPQAVVIANSNELHIDVALAAARRSCDLLIEKPLSNSLRGVDALAREVESRGLIVETGFMSRFHPNLTWLKSCLDSGELGSVQYVRAVFGQYLPDWRPGTDHRRCYSARRGIGGVIFDRVHELDLMGWLIGPIVEVGAMTAHVASLEIESESVAQLNLRCDTGALAQVHLDYVRPVHTYSIEVVGDRGVLTWDYSAGTVHMEGRHGSRRLAHQVPAGFERNDMFVAHMRYFLERLSSRTLPPAASLMDAIAALRAALACHQAAREKRTVDPAAVAEECITI
jgi:predicted dehydrogenase